MINPFSGATASGVTAPTGGPTPTPQANSATPPVPGKPEGFVPTGDNNNSSPQQDAATRSIVAGILGGSHGDGCTCGSCAGNTNDPLAPLKARNQEVEDHENAHHEAAGSFATGGPEYDTQTGPDGKSYRIGGKVHVDTSEIQGDPQKTADKMNQIIRAATAPKAPSGQDLNVAAQARGKLSKATDALTSKKPGTPGAPHQPGVQPNVAQQQPPGAPQVASASPTPTTST